jgi:cell division protein FtsI (penicillin-binding protein 3)
MMLSAWRVFAATLAFLVLAGTGGARLVYLHVIEKDFLQDQGDARTIRMEKIPAHRGMIRDRQGKPLAISTPVVSLWANPGELLAQPEVLDALALHLDVEPEKFREKLNRNSSKSFVYLRRRMPPTAAQKILELKLKGVYSRNGNIRDFIRPVRLCHMSLDSPTWTITG